MKEGEGKGKQEALAALRLENQQLKQRLQEQTQLTHELAKSVSLAAGPLFVGCLLSPWLQVLCFLFGNLQGPSAHTPVCSCVLLQQW